jgi:hypothetical protein
MRADAVRVGRSTGVVDARVDDYSDFDRDLSIKAFTLSTGDGSTDARRRLGGGDRKRRGDGGDCGEK